jgi:hypothetical protein
MVMVMLVRATEAPAQPPDCVARGTFVFTLAEGSGFLYLLADGRAEMAFIPASKPLFSVDPGSLEAGSAGAPSSSGPVTAPVRLATRPSP